MTFEPLHSYREAPDSAALGFKSDDISWIALFSQTSLCEQNKIGDIMELILSEEETENKQTDMQNPVNGELLGSPVISAMLAMN